MDERISLFAESTLLKVVETADENCARSFSLFSMAPLVYINMEKMSLIVEKCN